MELLLFPRYFLLISSLLVLCSLPLSQSGDAEALLALKSSIDPSNSLPWPQGSDFCQWQGIRECIRGRVTKLVAEHFNLSGTLDEKSLNELDQLRVLSFKANSISGEIRNISGLTNLKSLFLNDNQFSGGFPSSITDLHRLKVIVLSGNQISGEIPSSLFKLQRLYILYLQDNRFTGQIPPLNQTSLRFFNVSTNKLSGEIPITAALIRFNSSSFSNNLNLCGKQLGNPCSSPNSPSSSKHSRRVQLIKIIAGTIGGFVLLLITLCLLWVACKNCRRRRKAGDFMSKEVGIEGNVAGGGGEGSGAAPNGRDGNNGLKQGGFSWEGEGLGSLVFLGAADQHMTYALEDLLKASAETLGRGTIGSTYKAVMQSGFIVTVKRLKDSKYPRLEEFRRQMDVLGLLRHPNLVPLRAYFQAKEERLLVYDYFPNGSLFSLIHGTRGSSGGKPLHWTSCLKIAEDLAAGLVYLHQTLGITHGNLKSSNVLLGSDFESCLTDYGLMSFRDPESVEETSVSSLFYRAPECRDPWKPFTQQSDAYSFGVLLLELLTGKTPFLDLVQEHGADIPRWVRSVREEEMESGDDPSSGNETAEEKLGALLNIAMACVSLAPESRPVMSEVLRMIRDARVEAQVSSNSSDHSPGRWSDTVQSLPREEHLGI
ncbi:inactive leucine-rich repeat receptor-like serine/threonine-protein kinase At1g60630 isoform X2 [Telopea speciosissima]|uniref:inactive leucine-rich repeat receptor-like serine/threonine-protein kinase At1g60630 isoform X2 n=1 Tax=Telopea speciosissima TaxID=54955 RepID=UPI001CC4FD1E|nr:inactive leucine-rich repeat receptor-like serine/threonine-protein kinase At1g60630 isoform X2 [Telopea speciosissima]